MRRMPASAERGGHPTLPCLSSNNSDKDLLEGINRLTGGHKRTAFALRAEIQNLAKDFGVEKMGFLTLTFADHIVCIKEAQRRFNNLNRRVLKSRYQRAIGCWERQGSGRIHFHLVVVLKTDIRTGFNFDDLQNQQGRARYRSATPALRAEWTFWRAAAPGYGFGRTELLPVKSTADGIAYYVGKYVSKHIGKRWEGDKGARVVRFIGFKPGDRRVSSRFSWNTEGYWLWRMKLKTFCESQRITSMDVLKERFGRRWAYHLQETIFATVLGASLEYPTQRAAEREIKRGIEADTWKGRLAIYAMKGKNGNQWWKDTMERVASACVVEQWENARSRATLPDINEESSSEVWLADVSRGAYRAVRS